MQAALQRIFGFIDDEAGFAREIEARRAEYVVERGNPFAGIA